MDKQRRKFLKIAGATALAGVSAPAIANLSSKESFASSEGHGAAAGHGETAGHGEAAESTAIRYGMVIDMTKFYGKPEMLDAAINACRKVHNIPDFRNEDGTPDTKNEIKWIWKAPFENVCLYVDNRPIEQYIPSFVYGRILTNACLGVLLF